MYKHFTPILVVSLLSGCTLIDGDKYTQTNQAIQQSETNLSSQIAELDNKLNLQYAQIETLESHVAQLNTKLAKQNKPVPVVSEKKQPPATPVVSTKPEAHTVLLGAIENVTLDAVEMSYKARVDTGAATSSLNAIDVENFERNGKQWVRFHMSDQSQPKAKDQWIEAPVIRFVKIRQVNSQKIERRPVVELWVKVGSIHEKTPFTLTDRSQMTHPILLGREFIKDIAIVDVSKNYIQSTNKK